MAALLFDDATVISTVAATHLLSAELAHPGRRGSPQRHALIQRLNPHGVSQNVPRLLAPEPIQDTQDDTLAGDLKQPRRRGRNHSAGLPETDIRGHDRTPASDARASN